METNSLTKLCRVCGDKALGFNFNALSCECCKIFFSRNALRRENLFCKFRKCEINIESRKCCQKCRLEKCFRIGMKMETINSRSKRKRISPNDTQNGIQQESISRLLPSYEMQRLFEVQNGMNKYFLDDNTMTFAGRSGTLKESYNCGVFYIRSIIRFCKCMDGFRWLNADDQLILLKSFYIDILSVRSAFFYSTQLDGLFVTESEDGDRVILIPIREYRPYQYELNVETFFRNFICSLQANMESDNVIRDLCLAYLLFQPQQNVQCLEFLKYYQTVYAQLLKRYLAHKYQDTTIAEEKYSKLMQNLGELSKLSLAAKRIYSQFNRSEIKQLLGELFV